MLATIASLLISQALPPDPDQPIKWPIAEKIVAELQKGIAPVAPRRGTKSHHQAHNRIWTVDRLISTFGEPASKGPDRLSWTWKRPDGIAHAFFASRGYGGSIDPGQLRLEIRSIHFQPAQDK